MASLVTCLRQVKDNPSFYTHSNSYSSYQSAWLPVFDRWKTILVSTHTATHTPVCPLGDQPGYLSWQVKDNPSFYTHSNSHSSYWSVWLPVLTGERQFLHTQQLTLQFVLWATCLQQGEVADQVFEVNLASLEQCRVWLWYGGGLWTSVFWHWSCNIATVITVIMVITEISVITGPSLTVVWRRALYQCFLALILQHCHSVNSDNGDNREISDNRSKSDCGMEEGSEPVFSGTGPATLPQW